MMSRSTVTVLAMLALFMAPTAVWAGPKAVVVTGWNKNAKDKEWHDKIAAEAKKDLEAAGYEVTVITEATNAEFQAAVNDPNNKGLVYIDHGATDKEKVGLKDPNGKLETTQGSDFAGDYSRYEIVTIHACDQNQQSWKDKFSDASFHSWDDCVYPSTELTWQTNNEYPDANSPDPNNRTSNGTDQSLLEGQFLEEGTSEILYPINPLSGNWPMSSSLAAAFGNLTFNFFIADDDLLNPQIIFSAEVDGGVIIDHSPDLDDPNSDFDFTMKFSTYIAAIEDPTILVSPGVLGEDVVIDTFGPYDDEWVLFFGVRRLLFRLSEPLDNPLLPSWGGAGMALLLLGLGLMMIRRRGLA
jgi:hypothetical protein